MIKINYLTDCDISTSHHYLTFELKKLDIKEVVTVVVSRKNYFDIRFPQKGSYKPWTLGNVYRFSFLERMLFRLIIIKYLLLLKK